MSGCGHQTVKEATHSLLLRSFPENEVLSVSVIDEMYDWAYRMNPKECTDAPALWTRRHLGGDLELRETRPYTGLIDTEDSKVLWLDISGVIFVGDGHSTASQVVKAVGVICRSWGFRTNVVEVVRIPNVTAFRRGKERGSALVARNLRGCGFTSGQLEDIAVVGRVV